MVIVAYLINTEKLGSTPRVRTLIYEFGEKMEKKEVAKIIMEAAALILSDMISGDLECRTILNEIEKNEGLKHYLIAVKNNTSDDEYYKILTSVYITSKILQKSFHDNLIKDN